MQKLICKCIAIVAPKHKNNTYAPPWSMIMTQVHNYDRIQTSKDTDAQTAEDFYSWTHKQFQVMYYGSLSVWRI